MSDFLRDWMPLIALIVGPSAGVVAANWSRKSQSEANRLTGTNFEVERYNKFANEVQEERDAAKRDLKEEREQHRKEFAQLRADFEAFKKSVEIQFSGYRAYIHGLRGQVHDLGGVPHEWPKDLDQ